MSRLAAGRAPAAVSLGILLLVAAVFGQAGGFRFVNFDDGEYVYANPNLLGGLTPRTLAWAFTTGYAANWHPLTWLSHALDVTLFGGWAGGHHLTSVAIHGTNAVLLFLVLRAMTSALWRSALVAALFAIHPLHVEAVAWVSERKELLGALFGILAVGAYHRYARRPSPARMAAVAALFALSLLAKPMWVTLPCVLLLLDRWPLARHEPLRRLAIEKLPLLALSAASCAATWFVQSRSGAVASGFPLAERALNAPIAVLSYLRQTLWPSGLAVFYPHPASVGQAVPRASAALALAALASLAVAAVAMRRRRPYVGVGLLWFLGTLVPVIGLVQVGSQSRADRYTYLPLVGIFVAVAWLLGDWAAARPGRRAGLAGVAATLLLALAAAAHRQASVWRDGGRLYGHAIGATQDNWLAWNNLGMTQLDGGDLEAAIEAFGNAARIKPDYADAWYNAGVALTRLGEPERAAAAYREALRLDPSNADATANLALLRRHRLRTPEP